MYLSKAMRDVLDPDPEINLPMIYLLERQEIYMKSTSRV